MTSPPSHLRTLVFATLASVLTLTLILVACEIAFRQILCQWPQCDLIRNPDHRMTQGFYRDVNSDGIRSKREASDFHTDDYNIIFLGDSFVWGWFEPQHINYPAKKTIPARFEQLAREHGIANAHGINFGWVSASPLLETRLLKDIGHKYQPDLIVMVIDMTDFHDDRLYEAIIGRTHVYGIAQWLPATFAALSWCNNNVLHWTWMSDTLFGVPLNRYNHLQQPAEVSQPDFDRTMKNIDDAYHYSTHILKARFAVFILPRYFQYNTQESPQDWEKTQHQQPGPYSLEPFRYFDMAGKNKPYPIISLLPDMQTSGVFPTTWPNDPHLTPEGSDVVAKAIWQHLQKRQMLMSPPVSTP